MTHLPLAEFKRIEALARARKAKRAEKAIELWKPRPGAVVPINKAFKKKTASLYKFWLEICIGLVETYAKLRDRRFHGKCRICGERPIECAYHIIPRGKLATAFDVENIVGACNPCNNGERYHRLEYRDKHRKIFGAKFYDALWEKSKQSVKYSVDDLKEVASKIRELIRGIQC